MHGEAARWQSRLRRELDSPGLFVRWNEGLCRFQVGQLVREGASDYVDWFYTVTDGMNGFKPLDQRTVRKLHSMDKAKNRPMTATELRSRMTSAKAEREMRAADERRYRIRHEAKFLGGRFGFQNARIGP